MLHVYIVQIGFRRAVPIIVFRELSCSLKDVGNLRLLYIYYELYIIVVKYGGRVDVSRSVVV